MWTAAGQINHSNLDEFVTVETAHYRKRRSDHNDTLGTQSLFLF